MLFDPERYPNVEVYTPGYIADNAISASRIAEGSIQYSNYAREKNVGRRRTGVYNPGGLVKNDAVRPVKELNVWCKCKNPSCGFEGFHTFSEPKKKAVSYRDTDGHQYLTQWSRYCTICKTEWIDEATDNTIYVFVTVENGLLKGSEFEVPLSTAQAEGTYIHPSGKYRLKRQRYAKGSRFDGVPVIKERYVAIIEKEFPPLEVSYK